MTASRHSTYYYWPWYVDATLVLRKRCNASSSQKSAQICSLFICLSFSITLRFILLLIVYRACIFTRVWGLTVLLLLKTCIIPLIKVSQQNLNNSVRQFYMNPSCINTQKRKTKKPQLICTSMLQHRAVTDELRVTASQSSSSERVKWVLCVLNHLTTAAMQRPGRAWLLPPESLCMCPSAYAGKETCQCNAIKCTSVRLWQSFSNICAQGTPKEKPEFQGTLICISAQNHFYVIWHIIRLFDCIVSQRHFKQLVCGRLRFLCLCNKLHRSTDLRCLIRHFHAVQKTVLLPLVKIMTSFVVSLRGNVWFPSVYWACLEPC